MDLGESGRAALDGFLGGLRESAGGRVRSVVLFGSRARGDARPDSDVDLFLVVDRRDEVLLDIVFSLALDALLVHGILLSPKVCAEPKLEEMRRVRDPLLGRLESEGRELWRTS